MSDRIQVLDSPYLAEREEVGPEVNRLGWATEREDGLYDVDWDTGWTEYAVRVVDTPKEWEESFPDAVLRYVEVRGL